MGVLSNTRELKEDVLFRSSEGLVGSKWEATVVKYLNRCYRTLATGASEFLPEYVEDWWWLRGKDALNLEPPYTTGTVALTNNSTSITFSPAPVASQAGRRLVIPNEPDKPLVLTHTAGVGAATLDVAWTGDTNTAATFRSLKTTYQLATTVQVVMSPIIIFRSPERIIGVSPERMDELYPLARLDYGIPQAFALETEESVRFSHGGHPEGDYMRVEYRYRPKVVDLVDTSGSIPLVPAQWMHLLADMALTYVLFDKNDDRSNAAALAARTGLAAMIKENRRRLVKMDTLAGKIMPRPRSGSSGAQPPA